MAQVIAETQKVAGGPAGPFTDYYRAWLIANPATPATMTNAQLMASGAGFWADMAKQGALGLPQGTVTTVFS